MKRLVRSFASQVRAMQMSENELFCFCEGKNNDRYFYSKVLGGVIKKGAIKREIKAGHEIDGEGGKQALVDFFRYLRSSGKLATKAFGKAMCCVFFFDKDIDCIQRSKLRSTHAVYTEKYDVEASIFYYGELRDAVASSLSLDLEAIRAEHHNARKWCERVAVHWKEWISACVFSKIYSLDCGCGFARPSRINPNFVEETDLAEYENFKQLMRARSGFDADAFAQKYASIEAVIEKLIAKGELFRIFKGKWLPQRARSELERMYGPAGASFTNATGERLLQAMLSTLPTSGPWLTHFRKQLERPIAQSFGADVLLQA